MWVVHKETKEKQKGKKKVEKRIVTWRMENRIDSTIESRT